MNDIVSIMMAAYNGSQFVAKQIDSIILQTYTNWVLYISDDGSTDDTLKIIEQYQSKYPNKIVLLRNDHEHGATENFAFLLQNVPDTRFYAFCDQDDIWMSNKLQVMVDEYEKNDLDKLPALLYSELRIIDQNDKELCHTMEEWCGSKLGDDNHLEKLALANYIPGCAMFFNHRLYELVEVIPNGIVMHDWWVAFNAAVFGIIWKVGDKPLFAYRQHLDNVIGLAESKTWSMRIHDAVCKKSYRNRIAEIKMNRSQAILQIEKIIQCDVLDMSLEKEDILKRILSALKCRLRLLSIVRGLKYEYQNNTLYVKVLFWWFGIQ